MNWLLAALLCVLLVEIALRLPFADALAAVTRSSGRAARVVASKRISDHWKEKAMGAYARATFGGTLRLAALILAVFGPAAVLVVAAEQLGAAGFSAFLFSWAGLGFTLIFACFYAWIRMKQRRG